MKPKNLTHLTHYIILLTLMVIGILLFSVSGGNRQLQFLIILAISLSYFAWGIIHHLIEKNLYKEVFIQYFLFALLGLCSITALIFYL